MVVGGMGGGSWFKFGTRFAGDNKGGERVATYLSILMPALHSLTLELSAEIEFRLCSSQRMKCRVGNETWNFIYEGV